MSALRWNHLSSFIKFKNLNDMDFFSVIDLNFVCQVCLHVNK